MYHPLLCAHAPATALCPCAIILWPCTITPLWSIIAGDARQRARIGVVQGPEHDPGVSFRSAAELFRIIRHERTDCDYRVSVTLFEIYNEQVNFYYSVCLRNTRARPNCQHRALPWTETERSGIALPDSVESSNGPQVRDLLVDPKEQDQKKYEIKQGEKGLHIPELQVREIYDHKEVVDVMAQGLQIRKVGRTNANEVLHNFDFVGSRSVATRRKKPETGSTLG